MNFCSASKYSNAFPGYSQALPLSYYEKSKKERKQVS